ncbi:helix-turn-helix domain-containing protein [Paenibacillus odorifer]|uniref:helix-turn-helix domain-containing protein n=1 Tax=Paenibacillus odorifer TaxID=189426 RepID=UPI00096BE7C3|nr:helix-turn-helix transcriptional regulator [Paenibacillus odorifer]OMD69286.1 hypothetical protein BSK50_28840 [Paenibacillus odorifer]
MDEKLTREQELGALLKTLRERSNLTLRYVAEKCNISAAHLSNIEHGRTSDGRVIKASAELLRGLSYVYEFPYDILLNKAGLDTGYRVIDMMNETPYISVLRRDSQTIRDATAKYSAESNIGNRLKELMNSKGLTPGDLSEMVQLFEINDDEYTYLKFEKDYIEKVLENLIEPSVKFIKACSQFFHVSCDFIISGKEFIKPNENFIKPSTIAKQSLDMMNTLNKISQKLNEIAKDDPLLSSLMNEGDEVK